MSDLNEVVFHEVAGVTWGITVGSFAAPEWVHAFVLDEDHPCVLAEQDAVCFGVNLFVGLEQAERGNYEGVAADVVVVVDAGSDVGALREVEQAVFAAEFAERDVCRRGDAVVVFLVLWAETCDGREPKYMLVCWTRL